MKDLIEALQIFLKYTSSTFPTHCEHDVLYVDVSPELVSQADKVRLAELSFTPGCGDGTEHGFTSFRFGSC